MSFSGLLSRMLVLLAFICVGVVCSKLHVIDEKGRSSINQLVLYICGPLLIIKSVQNVSYTYGISDILMMLLYSVLLHVVLLLIGAICARLFCKEKSLRGTFTLVSAFGNIFFMGVPVISSLYGDGAVFLLSILVIPFNFLIFTLGIYLILGSNQKQIPWKKLLVNPSLYATILALPIFLLRIALPGTVTEIIGYLGQMVVPLSMLLIGAALGQMSLREIFGSKLSYAICAIKLLIAPVVTFLLLRGFVKDNLLLGILTVVAAMPSASIAPILCAEYGGESAFANRTVFMTTILSLATIPLIVWLLLR